MVTSVVVGVRSMANPKSGPGRARMVISHEYPLFAEKGLRSGAATKIATEVVRSAPVVEW